MTSFMPGNSLQGANNNPQPTVLNFYQDNIPRGRVLSGQTYWSGSKPARSATLYFSNIEPYTFTTGINDSISISINGAPLKIIEFDARTYTASEIVDLFNSQLSNVVAGLTAQNQLYLTTLSSGAGTQIRVQQGNTVLGVSNDTQVVGSDLIVGNTPPLTIAPLDTRQVELHFWKSITFVTNTDLKLNNCCIQISSRHYQRFIGSNPNMDPILALSSYSTRVSELKGYRDKNWTHNLIDLKTPLKIDGTEKDALTINLVDFNGNLTTDGIVSGEIYVSCEGWSIERARY